MSTLGHHWRNRLATLLAGLPVLSLVLAVMAWLRYGIDLPWFDDWRGYATGMIDSLDPRYLLRPMNDTMSPVGLALDALAQRLLDGNSIAYQFLSMVTVLGSLLALQWKLLSQVMGNRLEVAVCFLFTVLMLQPDSYWGLENLAYYQGLPLVFILWAMLLLAGPAPGPAWRGPAVATLGLLAGMTYISGAFGALAAGVTSLVLIQRLYTGDERSHKRRDWLWFTAAAAATVALQVYFSMLKFRGTHAGIPLALPTEAQFWAFYLGKLGRSLLLPPDWPWTSLLITLGAFAIAVTAAMLLLRRATQPAGTDRDRRVASIYLPLGVLVGVYLMLIAAGRTNFRPPEMHDLMQIFAHGFSRFHFFWATLIWPWVLAAVLTLNVDRPWPGRMRAWFIPAAGASFAALAWVGGGFAHMASQHGIGEARTNLAHCLLRELQRGGEIRCPGLLPPQFADGAPDAFPAYWYARKIDASFVRIFPALPAGKRRETIAPFFAFDAASPTPRVQELEALGNGLFRSLGRDPQMYLQTRQPQITRRCMTMDVDIEIKVSGRDTLQLFYVPAGDNEAYSEQNVATAAVGGTGGLLQTISFRLESETGFFESLRLDPVIRPQLLAILSVRVYCVRELP